MTKAVEWLEENITDNTRILEYGAGASTLWFRKRSRFVVTIEHHPEWAEKIGKPLILASRPYHGIVKYLDMRFDFILVDGRDRMKCMESCRDSLVPGGVLMLDNSERSKYKLQNVWAAGWEVLGKEIQIGADEFNFTHEGWETTWWRKPS